MYQYFLQCIQALHSKSPCVIFSSAWRVARDNCCSASRWALRRSCGLRGCFHWRSKDLLNDIQSFLKPRLISSLLKKQLKTNNLKEFNRLNIHYVYWHYSNLDTATRLHTSAFLREMRSASSRAFLASWRSSERNFQERKRLQEQKRINY